MSYDDTAPTGKRWHSLDCNESYRAKQRRTICGRTTVRRGLVVGSSGDWLQIMLDEFDADGRTQYVTVPAGECEPETEAETVEHYRRAAAFKPGPGEYGYRDISDRRAAGLDGADTAARRRDDLESDCEPREPSLAARLRVGFAMLAGASDPFTPPSRRYRN